MAKGRPGARLGLKPGRKLKGQKSHYRRFKNCTFDWFGYGPRIHGISLFLNADQFFARECLILPLFRVIFIECAGTADFFKFWTVLLCCFLSRPPPPHTGDEQGEPCAKGPPELLTRRLHTAAPCPQPRVQRRAPVHRAIPTPAILDPPLADTPRPTWALRWGTPPSPTRPPL